MRFSLFLWTKLMENCEAMTSSTDSFAYIHIHHSRNVSLKITKIKNFIFLIFLSNSPQIFTVLFEMFFSFHWINLKPGLDFSFNAIAKFAFWCSLSKWKVHPSCHHQKFSAHQLSRHLPMAMCPVRAPGMWTQNAATPVHPGTSSVEARPQERVCCPATLYLRRGMDQHRAASVSIQSHE